MENKLYSFFHLRVSTTIVESDRNRKNTSEKELEFVVVEFDVVKTISTVKITVSLPIFPA